ncbi:MAG: hypothetical protein M3119_00905 [Verrucomicrobiota bacterium]|nr:hypothetical protein [Verrucomicrobiota bacterium]
MREHLRNPEYVHVLLNPLPVYGLGLGLFGLIIALISRARAARVTALAIVFVSTISVWPVFHYGDSAYDRVLSMSDNDGRKWLDEHRRRAEQLVVPFYVVAALAATALLCEHFAPRASVLIGLTTAVLAAATLGAGVYIATAGGRIRHREFRYVPAPENATQDDE